MSKKSQAMSENEQKAAVDELEKIFNKFKTRIRNSTELDSNEQLAQFMKELAIWKSKYPSLSLFTGSYLEIVQSLLNEETLTRFVEHWLAVFIIRLLETKQEQQDRYLKDLKASLKSAGDDDTKRLQAVRNWKSRINSEGFSLEQFDKSYAKIIFPLLLSPIKNLRLQAAARRKLTSIQIKSRDMSPEELANAMAEWQNTFVLKNFPKEIQKEFNGYITEILKVRDNKAASQEEALAKVKDFASSNNREKEPAKEIPEIVSHYDYNNFDDSCKLKIAALTATATGLYNLSVQQLENSNYTTNSSYYISPTEQYAIDSLKSTPHTIESFYFWTYNVRNTNFGPEASEQLLEIYSRAWFPKLNNGSYNLPSLSDDATPKAIEKAMEGTVFYFFKNLAEHNKLSSTDKSKLEKTQSHVEKPQIVISVKPNVVKSVASDLSMQKDNMSTFTPTTSNTIFRSNIVNEKPTAVSDITIIMEQFLDDPFASVDLKPHRSQSNTNTAKKDNKLKTKYSFEESTNRLEEENAKSQETTSSIEQQETTISATIKQAEETNTATMNQLDGITTPSIKQSEAATTPSIEQQEATNTSTVGQLDEVIPSSIEHLETTTNIMEQTETVNTWLWTQEEKARLDDNHFIIVNAVLLQTPLVLEYKKSKVSPKEYLKSEKNNGF